MSVRNRLKNLKAFHVFSELMKICLHRQQILQRPFFARIYATQGRFGAVSRRGICHIWFRGRHISPSLPYREARSVAESSEGPTASKSDRTGRNPGMTRSVLRSSAGSGGTAF